MDYNPWESGGMPLLNVAATRAATHALGPGTRAGVWVQGCPFRCPGCISPEWIPLRTARLIAPEELAARLLVRSDVDGLTLSGGEPMLQAAGLASMVRAARRQRDLTVICFSGFLLERLQNNPPGPGVVDLINELDVLIDGVYIEKINDGRGLRGSSNQRAHHLTERLKDTGFDFQNGPRQAEIYLRRESAFIIGVPPSGLLETFHDELFGHDDNNTVTGE